MSKLLVHSSTLWQKLIELGNDPKLGKIAAVAYVSDNSINFGEGDTLIVDASDEAIKCGKTSAKVLQEFYNNGADLYSLAGLHAKAIVFGGTAYIGSANLSKNSQNHLLELGVIITDLEAATNIVKQIKNIVENQTNIIKIDDIFISRISDIFVDYFEADKRRNLPKGEYTNAWAVATARTEYFSGKNSKNCRDIKDRMVNDHDATIFPIQVSKKTKSYMEFYEKAKEGDIVFCYARHEKGPPEFVNVTYIGNISDDTNNKDDSEMKIFYCIEYDIYVDWQYFSQQIELLNETKNKINFTSFLAKRLSCEELNLINSIVKSAPPYLKD